MSGEQRIMSVGRREGDGVTEQQVQAIVDRSVASAVDAFGFRMEALREDIGKINDSIQEMTKALNAATGHAIRLDGDVRHLSSEVGRAIVRIEALETETKDLPGIRKNHDRAMNGVWGLIGLIILLAVGAALGIKGLH